MQYSTNYHMYLPDGVDRYNVEDFNTNIRIIDSTMKSISDSLSASSSNVNDLASRMTTVETKASTNEGNISTLQNSLNSVAGRVTTNENNISGLSTRMDAVETKNTNLDTRTGNLEDVTNSLEGELTANGTKIYMDYQGGKYGYNTSEGRGADTFHPFSEEQEQVEVKVVSGRCRGEYTGGGTVQSFTWEESLEGVRPGLSKKEIILAAINNAVCSTNGATTQVRTWIENNKLIVQWRDYYTSYQLGTWGEAEYYVVYYD